MKRKIVAFEGIDGSGKTTLLAEVSKSLALKTKAYKVIGREITPSASIIDKSFVGLELPPESEICSLSPRTKIPNKL